MRLAAPTMPPSTKPPASPKAPAQIFCAASGRTRTSIPPAARSTTPASSKTQAAASAPGNASPSPKPNAPPPATNPSVDRNNIRILTSPINNNDVYKNLFIAPGKYLVALDVYKEPGTTMQKFRTRGRGGELANNLVWDIENIAEGEWVTLAQEVEYLKVPTTWFFEFIGADNPDAVGMQTFYVDNWRLSANETRP